MGFYAGSFVQVSTPSGVNFRSSPKVDPANMLDAIPNGAVMQVVGDSIAGGQQIWTNVMWGGRKGFVAEQFLIGSQQQQVPVGTLEVTGSGVALRTDPSASAKAILITGPVGDTVESAGVAINQYVAVAYKGESGWMSASFLKPVGAQAPLARTLPVTPTVTPLPTPSPLVTTTPVVDRAPSAPSGGAMLAGGLLALAVVIYFMAK